MTRRILITLGSTTDAERCGDCPHMDHAFWECVAFDRRVATVRRDKPLRLHECIAAEKAAETQTTANVIGDGFPYPCHRCGDEFTAHVVKQWHLPIFCPDCREKNQPERQAMEARRG